MRAQFLLLLFLIIVNVVPILGAQDNNNEFIKGKICIGTNGRMSVPSNRPHHYRNLRDRFTNCTYVDGNLELTWLGDENMDLSFLQYIREVTGYVLISHVDVPKIVLPRLQIIRGRTLFRLNVRNEEFALLVTLSKMFTLEMPALRDVLNGGVAILNNYNLCHVRSIEWDEIITGPNSKYVYNYNFTSPERPCPSCDPSCPGGCWGEGPHNCQKFSKINCSPQCYQGRCFGKNPRECCHLFCAGGCTGPKQSDCLACRNFYDDGVCTQECPAMMIYNSITYSWEPNPNGKYAYGATCVRNCPEHLLKDNGACVRSCPEKKKAVKGECVPCEGPCPKTCSGVDIVHSGNIDTFKDCTVIEGSLVILEQTFKGYQQIYPDFKFGPRYAPMHPDSLKIFSTLKEVTGFVNIQAYHEEFTNLSYFHNLEVIGGRQLMENLFASLYIVKTALKSLELKSLNTIRSGAVAILENNDLCFADSIDWTNIRKSTTHSSLIQNNRNPRDCESENLVCNEHCSNEGCWGAGPDQCLSCRSFKYGNICVGNCTDIQDAYKAGPKLCEACHPYCSGGCSGPGANHCLACKDVRDGPYCTPNCPVGKYNFNGECVLCHETCVGGCVGPDNTVGHNGCNSCDKAVINGDVTVDYCLNKNDSCPNGYYYEWVGPQEEGPLKPLAGKLICRKCHPRCNKCTGYGFHVKVCQVCNGYKRGEQCEDECANDHYAKESSQECIQCHEECKGCTGPGPGNCIECRNFKVYEDNVEIMNTTAFNCTLNCPPEYPHKIYRSDNIEPFCSAQPKASDIRMQESKTPAILVGALVCAGVLLVCVIIISYVCRQRAKEKEKAVKMTMVLTGCEDSEPLRPTNVRPNLAKLRIIKDADIRKGGELGKGAFGIVYKGVWIPEGENVKIPVAIKVLKDESKDQQKEKPKEYTSKEFLEEAFVMASVEHPNLLQLLAVCMTSQMMLITQLMPLGCLLDYVRNNKDKIGSKPILNWSTQIARGMAYLEERRLVHRDLAARNVLLQTPNFVKITDFGLAKFIDINEQEYTADREKMPIKWLAVESLRHKKFTHKSDVWAFGVTIWELVSFGARPYEGKDINMVLDFLERGQRLPQPEDCSIELYTILLSCWLIDQASRPSFKQLVLEFAEMARDPGRFLNIEGDKFQKLPSRNHQDEKDMLKSLAGQLEGPEPVMEADEYLQPKSRMPLPAGAVLQTLQCIDTATLVSEVSPNLRYCSEPLKTVSDGEHDLKKETHICGIKLDLPVDEDDYLMPSTHLCMKQSSPYMDLIGDAKSSDQRSFPDFLPSVDNPEYLMGLQGSNISNIPTQTLGIPHVEATPNEHKVAPARVPKEEEASDHEYYNDLQRELQPLRRSETTV